jgi:phenylpropionate dioxygenase-like ring-hydroxylating dioxygenase large terminal subunit
MIHDPVLLNDWHPVATVDQLRTTPVIGLRLLGEDIVAWMSPQGPRVWQDLCVHRGTRLSLGSVCDGRLACPYHGWQYGASGACEHIPAHPDQAPPAKAAVKTYRSCLHHGFVFASLGDPVKPPAWFDAWDDATVRKVPCGPYTVRASAPRVVENFLDVAHFPFVHEGYLGVKDRPEISDYEAEITADGVVASGVRVFQPNGYGDGRAAEVEYTYKALRPLTAYFKKEAPTQQLSIILYVTPNDLVQSTAWMIMAENYMGDTPAAGLVAFQDTIFAQDAPILQSQRPELLPLDLQAELHLKSDRTAIAYRRWLLSLGMTLGTRAATDSR